MRIESKHKPCLVILTVFLVFGNACSNLTKGKGNAEAAVVLFHNQFNAGQFREIYGQTDEEFKKATNEADFVTLLEAVRRKLGTVKQASPTGWRMNATAMGTIVTLGYNVEFSEGKGTEEFAYRVSGGKALLLHYNVNSALLITK